MDDKGHEEILEGWVGWVVDQAGLRKYPQDELADKVESPPEDVRNDGPLHREWLRARRPHGPNRAIGTGLHARRCDDNPVLQ